ncbi:MAG: hypothetical protein OXG39_00270 [Chloroflexi bacterium]|nr:hypothetical protein [Chloroflexota bacterium]
MPDHTMSNVHLVTIAIANLGGHETYVDTEDIAIQVNELAPGKFSWRKYPEYIDLQVVKYALQDARRERNGGLVVGGSSGGWMLSLAGMEWINDLDTADKDTRGGLVSYRKGSLLLSQELELNRLRRTEAFSLYRENKTEELLLIDLYKFARINEYFPAKTRQRRFIFIENVVSRDAELQDLWSILKERFAEEFE